MRRRLGGIVALVDAWVSRALLGTRGIPPRAVPSSRCRLNNCPPTAGILKPCTRKATSSNARRHCFLQSSRKLRRGCKRQTVVWNLLIPTTAYKWFVGFALFPLRVATPTIYYVCGILARTPPWGRYIPFRDSGSFYSIIRSGVLYPFANPTCR